MKFFRICLWWFCWSLLYLFYRVRLAVDRKFYDKWAKILT